MGNVTLANGTVWNSQQNVGIYNKEIKFFKRFQVKKFIKKFLSIWKYL